MRSLIAKSAVLLTCLLLTAIAGAQDPSPAAFRTKFPREIIPGQPVLVSTRVDKGPTIDGEVDRDPVWSQLPRSSHTEGAWTQIARKEASGRQTVVYSCFDKENLYFGFVCEEPELQNVKMDGSLAEAGRMVGRDDSAEVVLEVGGVQGEGDVYSFRANSRGPWTGWGLMWILANRGYHTPAWTSAGKFGPNRWMLEMAIPFAAIKRRPEEKGMACPSRGDVVGLKLIRYGAQQPDPKNRMVSVWNTDITCTLPYIVGGNGLLYFEDSTAVVDGAFSFPKDRSPWKRTGQVTKAEGKEGLALSAGATLSQVATVHPSSYYLLRVESDGKPPEVLVDGKQVEWKDGRAGVWTSQGQDKLTLTLQAAEASVVKKVTMEYQPNEEPLGVYCLTNNYRRPERNLRTVAAGAPEGRYQYVAIDYAGRILGDINPAIKVDSWAYDYNQRVEDLGGKAGWMPFGKGSLTGRPEPVFWQIDNPGDTVCWGRHTQVIDIDLGQEYYVRGLDVLWPGPNMINFEVWGKAKADNEWTYLYTGDGQFVEPSRRRSHRRGYDSVRGLDSVVRYVRWRATPIVGEYTGSLTVGYPQMDGIQEFWVWGELAGTHAGIKPFKPWMPAKAVPPVPSATAVLDPDAPLILPRPRAVEKTDGWFVVGPGTRIVAQQQPEAMKVAQQIRSEILERWNIDVPVVPEPKEAASVADAIYVGCIELSETAKQLAAEEALEIDASKPQAYGLRAGPRRVVVLARDDDGLYFGVQSLMMALRWKSSAEGGGPGCRGMKVIDWPGTLERGIYNHKGYAALLNVPESEIPRVKRLCRLLSRMKFNALYVNPADGEGHAWPYASYSWPKGTMAKLCREVRDECHLEIRPILLPSEGMAGDWWKDMLKDANAMDAAEVDPDEAAEDLGKSMNVCPLHPRTYELAFEKIDRTLEEYGRPSKVWLFGQVYADASEGARWAVCRRCQKSGKSPEALYAYFLGRIAGHLSERHTRGLLVSPFLRYGERGSSDRRMISMDFRDVPRSLSQSLPDAMPAAVKVALSPAQCANGPTDWPSAERWVRGPWTETEILVSLSGGTITWGDGSVFREGTLAGLAEAMWYAPDKRPPGQVDSTDLGAWIRQWWFRTELPGWRAGATPAFFPLDLRPFANHDSRATGAETLEPGRPPEIDLRYLPVGRQTLANVQFDIIDPAQNSGKAVLMLGRPPKSVIPKVAQTIGEKAGPIPVGRKLASLAFLRTRWQCTVDELNWRECWLRPTCRVVYEDGSWLVVDAFQPPVEGTSDDDWYYTICLGLYYRLGWAGNCPSGQGVMLSVVEWVNPYPELTVKQVEFFTPDFGGRVNPKCEAIVAITGIEPLAQDLQYWAKRTGRTPRLPQMKPPADAGRLLNISGTFDVNPANSARGFSARLALGQDRIPYTLKLGERALLFAENGVCSRDSFAPITVTLEFGAPLQLDRVEALGPHHQYGDIGPRMQRTQKIDVLVEVSEDGRTWQRAGEIRGICADADFQTVGLPGRPIKALRLTGNAQPYHESYHPAQYWGGMFNTLGNSPHFSWRLFAAEDRTAP